MKNSKICNCHESSDKKVLKSKINSSFCDKCGCIIIKDSDGNIFYTLKSKHRRLFFDLSPIVLIKHMKKITDENYPFIYQDFNTNLKDKYKQTKELESINFYLKHRKMLILKLQKLIQFFDYCDLIFYQCLFYLDTYLSHHIAESTSEKMLYYHLIGFFLCASKFKETDIYEPSLDSFCEIAKGIYLPFEKIAYYEVVCLKMINYNVFSYSAYDWVMQLMSNGIIFNCEIDKNNEMILIKGHRHYTINIINKYILKLLLEITSKALFFKYAPMYLAFSLIRIAREKYLDKNIIKPKLFKKLVRAYGINPKDYKGCYEEIKSEMFENESQEEDKKELNEEKEKEKDDDENKNKNEINDDELEDMDKIERVRKSSFHQFKNVYVHNRMRSSHALVKVNYNPQINNNSNNKDSNNDKSNEISKEKDFSSISNESNKNNDKISNKKDKISNAKSKFHLSIDCSNNNNKATKSRDNLPIVNIDNNPGKRNSVFVMNSHQFETEFSQNLPTKKKKLSVIQNLKCKSRNANKSTNKINKTNIEPLEKKRERDKTGVKYKFHSNQNIINLKNEFNAEKSKNLFNLKLPKISVFGEDKSDKTPNNNNEGSNMISNKYKKSKNKY